MQGGRTVASMVCVALGACGGMGGAREAQGGRVAGNGK